MDNNIRELMFPPVIDNRRHPPPPTPTPTPHMLYNRGLNGQFSVQSRGSTSLRRSSIDTPLSLYATTRAKLKTELDAYLLQSSPRGRANTVPVPLSALCSPRAFPGAVGGPFNSTTKVKCLPLPTLYNRHQFSSRGIRNVGLHADRYVPVSDQQRKRTVSDSLLNLSKLHARQKEHLVECENNVYMSRTLQKQREVIPHRVEQAFYMSGLRAQLFNKEDIPQSELEALQKIALSQNTHLFYGKGIRSSGGKTSKTVKKFEQRLQETVSAQSRGYGLEDTGIDTGRYSRASRAVTPGSPIIEEKGEELSEQLTRDVSSKRTFITDSNK